MLWPDHCELDARAHLSALLCRLRLVLQEQQEPPPVCLPHVMNSLLHHIFGKGTPSASGGEGSQGLVMAGDILSNSTAAAAAGRSGSNGSNGSASSLPHKRKSTNMHEDTTMDYTALHAPTAAAAVAPATAAPKLRLLPATASMLAAKQQQQQKVPSPVLSSTTAPLLAGHARTASTASASIITPAAATAAVASAATQSTDDESPAKRAKLSKESSPSSSRTITSSSAAAAATLVPMPAEVSLMLAEFEMNLESRTHRLREQTKFMLTSLQRSFKNELNKIPAKVSSETCGIW